MDAWGYADEKLYLAVLELSRGVTTIQQRLQNARNFHLRSLFSDTHFPDPELLKKYKELMEDLDFLAPNGAGILSLPNEEAAEFATRIVGLFWKVARLAT